MPALGLALAYAALETLLALKGPGWLRSRWAGMSAALGAAPFLCGLLGRAFRIPLPRTRAAVLIPASLFSLLALPFLVLESLSQARSPGAGGLLHVILTALLILGCLLGAQALCAWAGWAVAEKLKNLFNRPMTAHWTLLAVVFFARHAAAQPALDKLASEQAPSLVDIYRRLHAHPELTFHERETSKLLARELSASGYAVTEQFGRYEDPARAPYGIVAVLRNGSGPTLLLRTDMDALPVEEKTGLPYASSVKTKNDSGDAVGVMHACGHDVHMSSWLGAARLLARLKENWKGTLILIGQPAEEMGAGAKSLLKGGLYERFPKPDFVLALHSSAELPAGKVGLGEGYATASSDRVEILVRGKGGHGAYPHATKDPIVLAAQLVLALQPLISRENSPFDPAVITVGSIHGGTKDNIIPNEVRLLLTVRALKGAVRQRILASIERVAKNLALAAGMPPELAPVVRMDPDPIPSTYNDPALTRRLTGVFQGLLGAENVAQTATVMAAEDFSYYGLEGKIPSLIFWLGAVNPAKIEESKKTGQTLPSLHSAEYAPLPDPAIRTGVKVLTAAALELLKK